MRLQRDSFSLIILKPDFLRLELFEELRVLLKEARLQTIGVSKILMDLSFVRELYQWEKVLYPTEINDYLCTISMPMWIVSGEDAIMKVLGIKRSLREKYCNDPLHTLIHCPDSHDAFVREYELTRKRMGGAMKTNNQVEVIVFKNEPGSGFRYLMLKRNTKKGGFWQPITGNVELGETFEQAAVRELMEETGIINFMRVFDTGYSFEFFDDNRQQLEKVFAAEVTTETEVVLSEEHTELQWATVEECITKYLKYPGNIAGLKALSKVLESKNE